MGSTQQKNNEWIDSLNACLCGGTTAVNGLGYVRVSAHDLDGFGYQSGWIAEPILDSGLDSKTMKGCSNILQLNLEV